jgi:hypothetical protein
MNSRTAAAALLLAVVASGAAPVPGTTLVSGHYRIDWEEQSFTPCGGHERWWVSDPGPLARRYRDVVTDRSWGTVYATIRVDVTKPGMYGHMGMYPRAAAVREVVEARAPAERDCRARTIEAE